MYLFDMENCIKSLLDEFFAPKWVIFKFNLY